METPDIRTSEEVITAITEHVAARHQPGEATLATAGLCLADALGCALGALATGEPQYLLGPYAPGTMTPRGARVPGTSLVLDPVKAAFDTSVLVRWLDLSDTSPVGGHPSDNIGTILAVADHVSRSRNPGESPLTMGDVLAAMTDAYDVHCALAAANRFDMPAVGLDHVICVKIASAALACRLMGGTADQIRAAVSHAFLDGADLNAYRHVPNAGPRKGWAGGNAASRGVILAWMAMRGEPAAPQPLSAKTWGFDTVMLGEGKAVKLDRPLGHFFMDNVIFKLVPAQRNASTAIEAAIALHPWFMEQRESVEKIHITTHDETLRRVVKSGPLPNREARDHCLQYMVAVALLKGRLELEDYSDEAAADPEIDRLRELMVVEEDERYTADHHDLSRKSCANAIEITAGGETSQKVEVLYPIGDAARRDEALPQLRQKFDRMTGHLWGADRQDRVFSLLSDTPRLAETPVTEFMTLVSEREV